jgi:hypothetical protein
MVITLWKSLCQTQISNTKSLLISLKVETGQNNLKLAIQLRE